ncbi:terminase large subunit [Enterococcus faecalis]|uniref:terminase large subunit n=1 Tax=Enterococcus faecalis TaxID=1351 RepID=UPI001CD4AF1F|nr:terminase TerL endonuclease subunit [Enterococcus faecalis]
MIDMTVNYADKFAKSVRRHKERYPRSIHLAVKRYNKWKKRKDIFFDLEKANLMLSFTESFYKHSTGEWSGQPLELEDWQKFYFSNIYGWQKWSDKWQRNVRVIRKSYLQVPKKNGKSLMEGAPILYGMYGDGVKGAQFYCLAADFDQAQNVANPLATVIENDNDLLDGTRVYRKEKKVTTISYAFFEDDFKYQNNLRVLSKREKVDGKNTYIVVADEVHEWEDTSRYDGLKSGQAAQPEPLFLVCSTAGKNSGALGVQIYQDSKHILEEDDDDDWFIMIYEPNKGYNWEDEKVWEMVNPNLYVSFDITFLRGEFKDALRNPFRKAEFLSKHLNVFVNYADNYFDKEQIDNCLVDDLGDITGEQVVIGIDLSRTTDLTCVSINIPTYNDEGLSIIKVKQMYFIPSYNIEEKEKLRNVPYSHYAEQGFVTLCEGRTVDYDLVFNYIIDMYSEFELDIVQINYDPAMAEKLVERFELEGFNCVEVPQYPTVMNEMLDDFEMLVDNGRVQTDNPLFIMCTNNTTVVTNINNQKAPSKRKSPEHIDGFVAFLIGHKESMNMMLEVGNEDEFSDYITQLYNRK